MSGVVEELERLVAFPTVSDRPVTALAAHLAQRAEDLGFRVERFDDPDEDGKCSVVAVAGPGDRPPSEGITLTGHMDVVPTEGQPWSSDPFRVTARDDGKLVGRGTADMKGFLAATYAALENIDVAALAAPVALVWTHDEEIGCLGSAKLVRAYRDEGRHLPQPCLVGEPTDFRILRMHAGHVAVEIVVHGEAAHSSRPDLGRNAVEGAARVVGEVTALAEDLRAAARDDLPEMERPWVAVNVARISGGSAINIVPDRCVVHVGYRPLPGQPAEAVWGQLQERLGALAPAVRWEGRVLRTSPAMLTDRGTALEALLATHAAAPELGAAGFATDGGNLADLGLQPLIFGPGSIDVAHKADEYIDREALYRAVDVVGQLVRARCTGG